MSYSNQLDWLIKGGDAFLDYERFNLDNLDERALNEAAGLSRVGSDAPLAPYGVRWYDGGLKTKPSGADKNVNWNSSGTATQTGVRLDINQSGARGVLRAHFPEWANIIYDGGAIGAGIPAMKRNMMTSPEDLVELTEEEYRRVRRNAEVVK